MGEPSTISRIFGEAKELAHEIGEHALTHGAAHVMEQAGKGLSKALSAPYPGTATLRPHSAWLWRAVPGLEGAAKILGSKAFGIATGVLTSSNNTPGSTWERRQNEAYALGQKLAEQSKPKVEQGIAYKNGAVYFPKSRQWVLPAFTITPSHAKHQEIAHKRPGATLSNPGLQNRASGFGLHLAQATRAAAKPANAAFGGNQGKSWGLLQTARHSLPVPSVLKTHMQLGVPKLTLPKLGQSLPFKPMTLPTFKMPQFRPPSMKGGFR